jgi:putative tryptophan/tyrosine transport system substrate-binding protein
MPLIIARRELVAAIGGAAVWALAARAQQAGKTYRIGFLANDPTIPTQPAGQAFLEGLRESGFVEGKNIIIERRFAEGALDRYAVLVEELLRTRPEVIVTSANPATVAVKQATTKIPIVMTNVYDPMGQGLVESLAHPGGNITGIVFDDSAEVSARRLQLLKDAIPRISRAAVLTNMDEPYARTELKALEQAAQSLSVALQAITVRHVSEYDAAFESMTQGRTEALLIAGGGSLHFSHRRLIIELANGNRLPIASNFREITEAGGLMSYSSVRTERFRRAAIYVAKILQGAKPADLPVEQPTKYEMVINLKTARSLGLEIPRDLLFVADDVIE